MHPPYSPDLAPNDYHLFLSLQNFLSDKKLGSREDCENRLLEFFANKGQDFDERGNMKLPLKWQQIIQQNAGVKNGRSLQGKLADGTVVEVEAGDSFYTDPISDKISEGSELANMVANDAKLAANLVSINDANLALPPRFRQ
ncbi:transposase [Trichonephila clavipes]|nr:transposase [Trichonephila clavipes]